MTAVNTELTGKKRNVVCSSTLNEIFEHQAERERQISVHLALNNHNGHKMGGGGFAFL